ncbi:hypothetical protein AMTRI_Chr07g77090 [Amborella trichopoda]|uniref:F-box domain-containing protein n=1 Tax=Amborella trichopoda TaxID=13333 RepID=U5D5W8_AMBTC|nr:F-box/kelch-repeat protein At3g24760 [Amborella trichopoda]XP_020529175.1 F-box/kelch-repeat protein At3g24760 [Amborella trichopoda]XP_020529176.1 F-box/kelch-repeat protein At3g24760 [Amborella trichopoda]XP_020529177.1 F-box/kelch-repeat protein At3g24760 [Amborella trichopoda]XP_020529178.1 F-box/kelch-repeat protein At3g24760 [Amborella trichopoda]ERN15748.1 hypothetical protein AMTR_s00039p00075390 [Amborella trichopoda]|eukprot:XP_006854281.1 F-box/kelch-repeat protein At3g24760 [Amborella trichopoda]
MDLWLESASRPETTNWGSLSSDLIELIFSYLPIRSIIRARAVCKLWHSLITEKTFASRVSQSKKPWFFIYGRNNIFLKNNQVFGFDPEANEWTRLPTYLFPEPNQEDSFVGSGGFFFWSNSSTFSRFCYAPVLSSSWKETAPLRFSRCNPLVGLFKKGGKHRFIVVGGVRFIGGLVDIEDKLAVEIYDSNSNSWELCPALPTEFESGNSSQSLSSALLNGKFFVFGRYSCSICSFDLDLHIWDRVQTLRPPGVVSSFLMACVGQLVLAGLCNDSSGPLFRLWSVDEQTMEFGEIGEMPRGLLYSLFDSEEDDKFASLKCVGLGNLIYVFNEEHSKMYPSCVCEIGSKFECNWRRVPDLPAHVNRFHKVISFCSTVALESIV